MLTNYILRRIDQIAQTKSPIQARVQAGMMAGIFGLLTNAALFGVKIFVGLFSGSVALIADAVNSLSDFAASILTITGFRFSGRKADDEHPFGHQRFEEISGFIMALIMMFVGLQFIFSSIQKIMNPTAIRLSTLAIVLLVISILLKLWQMFTYRRIGQKVDSPTLVTASKDARNDALTTLGILVAALISIYFKINLDGWIALVVAVFIVGSSFIMIHEFVNSLLGEKPNEDLIEEIADKLEQYDNILGFHDLMIHEYGHDTIFAVVHIELDSTLSLDKAHEIVDKIERDFIREDGIHLVAHIDPLDIHSKKYSRFYVMARETIAGYHAGLSIHDFHVEQLPNNDDLLQFDLRVPENSKFDDDEWLVQINNDLRRRIGDVTVQINFDHTDLGADHSLMW